MSNKSFGGVSMSYSSTIRTLPGSLSLVSRSKYSSNRFRISARVAGDPPVRRVARKSPIFTETLVSLERTSCNAWMNSWLRFSGRVRSLTKLSTSLRYAA